MPIIQACHDFLTEHAVGKWHETYRFKNKETDEYMHPIHRGMTLLRVETGTKRAFYWIYNIKDSKSFVEHVGLRLKSECHEVIITPRCRFFYDVDLALDEFQKLEFADHYDLDLTEDSETQVMEVIGDRLAHVFKEATLISLEEHALDIKTDLANFDWMFTMRNRKIGDDGFKISIHLITNLMLPLQACSAIASHVKLRVIEDNADILGINDSMISPLVDAVDETQYRRHGSLSLPFGVKHTERGDYVNWVYRDFAVLGQRWFITIEDQFSILDLNLSEYNIREKSNYEGTSASPEFVKEALQHASNIADYNPRVWDLNTSILKRSTMYVKRYAPSMCSICQRTHDNDNTLFLMFNSERGIASWKCARMPTMKPITFYRTNVPSDDADVEAFASRRKAKPAPPKAPPAPYTDKPTDAEYGSDEEDKPPVPRKAAFKRISRSTKAPADEKPIKDGYEETKVKEKIQPVIPIAADPSSVEPRVQLAKSVEYASDIIVLKVVKLEVGTKCGNTKREVIAGPLNERDD